MLNLILKNKKIKKINKEEKKTPKHFPSAVREWNNSIYTFNKNTLNLIPSTTTLATKLIKSFFNLYNLIIERKMRTKRLLLRKRRLSKNKIFLSNGEFKHTNNKVIITLYIFNRQKRNLINRMKKLRFFSFYIIENKKNIAEKILNNSKLKVLSFLKNIEKTKFNFLNFKNKFNHTNSTLNFYVKNFYKKYAKKSYIYIKTFFFYKQLIYINKTKYNYTFLKHLKVYLEKLYNKNVEFNLINIERLYLNSDIFSESFTLKVTKNRKNCLRILKHLQKKIKIKIKKKLQIKPILSKIFLKKKNIRKNNNNNNLFSELKYKDITGFRLEAKGRLTKRYTASRSVKKLRYKGNLLNIYSSHRGLSTVLLRNNLRSNLQYTKLKSKSRIGSFGIKGWLSGN